MLIAATQIRDCTLEGPDGSVGTVKDLLFDGSNWKVRYIEVDTGSWLPGRRVILKPEVIRDRDYAGQRLTTPMNKDQVENSPPLESDLPVSRQHEIDLAQYYAWGAYWTDIDFSDKAQEQGDPNLRGMHAVTGYHIQAMDGQIGHVDDFIVDDESVEQSPWEIRYLVIDTKKWLPGKQVLLPPMWAESIDWNTRRVEVGLTRDMVENCPEYNPNTPINRQYEEVFYDYYGRPRYWTGSGHTV